MTTYFYVETKIPPTDCKFLWVAHQLKSNSFSYIANGTGWPEGARTPSSGYIVQGLADDVIIVHRLRGIFVVEVDPTNMTKTLKTRISYHSI